MTSRTINLLPENDHDTDALFRDAESAIRFAMQSRNRSPQRDTIGKLRTVGGRGGKFDRGEVPAQAGMILAALLKLTEPAHAVLVVKLATRSMPCHCGRPCCAGWAIAPDWDEARGKVTMAAVEAFSGMITHYRLRDGLVRRWAGEKVDLGKLADACGVHRNTVGNHAKTASVWLSTRYKQALAQADSLLRQAGPAVLESGVTEAADA